MNLINDVHDELRQLDFSRKIINSFIIVMLVASTVIWYFWTNGSLANIYIGAFVFYFIAGFIFPVILKPFYYVWMTLAFSMGWIMSRILLSLIFYLIITPIGIVLKLSGKVLLEKSFNNNDESYWIKKINKINHSKMS